MPASPNWTGTNANQSTMTASEQRHSCAAWVQQRAALTSSSHETLISAAALSGHAWSTAEIWSVCTPSTAVWTSIADGIWISGETWIADATWSVFWTASASAETWNVAVIANVCAACLATAALLDSAFHAFSAQETPCARLSTMETVSSFAFVHAAATAPDAPISISVSAISVWPLRAVFAIGIAWQHFVLAHGGARLLWTNLSAADQHGHLAKAVDLQEAHCAGSLHVQVQADYNSCFSTALSGDCQAMSRKHLSPHCGAAVQPEVRPCFRAAHLPLRFLPESFRNCCKCCERFCSSRHTLCTPSFRPQWTHPQHSHCAAPLPSFRAPQLLPCYPVLLPRSLQVRCSDPERQTYPPQASLQLDLGLPRMCLRPSRLQPQHQMSLVCHRQAPEVQLDHRPPPARHRLGSRASLEATQCLPNCHLNCPVNCPPPLLSFRAR